MSQAERDAKIVAEYASLSASKLAAKYGISVPQIYRIVKEAGGKKAESQTPLDNNNSKVIDDNHRKIGMKLYFHRTTKKFQETDKASVELNWSVRKLRSIEQGFSVLNLIELITIAEYLGISVSSLLENI